ncbi:MAG: hypothetical protein ACRC50_09885 [Gaiella sp.]
MSAAPHDDLQPAIERPLQDREIALAHSLTAAEFALAREACAVGLLFERAGIAFDPATFVVLRIIEASLDGPSDPLECLRALDDNGVVGRSVGMAHDLLDATA